MCFLPNPIINTTEASQPDNTSTKHLCEPECSFCLLTINLGKPEALLQVVLSIAAAIVAFTSITIGAAYGLENSTKLYALTFMLVK